MTPQLFTNFAATCQTSFFGLVPWYGYLPKSDFINPGPSIMGQATPSACTIYKFQVLPGKSPSDIPLVLLAVVDDLLRIAGLVAVGFIIYAAIQYVTSQGNPEQSSRAQSTIINALVGLAVAIVAVVFVSYLGSALK